MEVKVQHYSPPTALSLAKEKPLRIEYRNILGLTLVLAFWRRKDSWLLGFESSNLGRSTATPVTILSQLLVKLKQTHYSTERALRVPGV